VASDVLEVAILPKQGVAERQLLLDASTYGERSMASARLPGALLRGLRFTL
jgi:hypothetical protein